MQLVYGCSAGEACAAEAFAGREAPDEVAGEVPDEVAEAVPVVAPAGLPAEFPMKEAASGTGLLLPGCAALLFW